MKTTPKATGLQGPKQKTPGKKDEPSAHDLSRYLKYTLTIQWILRHCSPFFSSNETMILLFVADRTYGWGWKWEVIPHAHFLNGVKARKDQKVHAGALSMTKPTLTKSLNFLIASGILKVRNARVSKEYQINTEWESSEASSSSTEGPSSSENGENFLPLTGQISLPHEDKNLSPKKSKGKNGKEKKVFPTGKRVPPTSLPEENTPSLDEPMSTLPQRPVSSLKKALSGWNSSTVGSIWEDLLKRHHDPSSHHTTKGKYRHALLQYGKKWIAANGSTENWLIYLKWCVANWSLIRSEKLAWMRGAPIQPSMSFFVMKSDYFEAAHEEKAVFESISKMSLRDREVEHRVQRGVPRDVAENEVDSRNGLAKERERLERAASAIKLADISAYGREREAEATARRKKRAADNARLTAPAEKGTFDQWQ